MNQKEQVNKRVKAFRERQLRAGMVQRTYFIRRERAGQIEAIQKEQGCNVNEALEIVFKMAFGEQIICENCGGYGCDECKNSGWVDVRAGLV